MDQPNLAFQKEKHLFITRCWPAKSGISAYNPVPFSPFKTPLVGGCDRVTQTPCRRGGGRDDVRLELPTNGVSLNQREVPAPHWNTPNLNQRLTTKLDESGWRQRAMRKAFVLSALRLPLLVRSHWLLVLHSTESIATCFSAPLRSMWPSFRVNCTTIQQLRKRGEKRRKEIEREEISGCMFQN